MKLNNKETKIISITLAAWGIVLITSGLIMNNNKNTITKTNYKLNIEKKQISQVQARTNEIKLKNLELEIGSTLSLNIKDYLEEANTIENSIIKSLQLDTSSVNINQSGEYTYTITYKKKKYIGNITIKEKETTKAPFTLKDIEINVGESLSPDVKNYINENLSDEILSKMVLNINEIKKINTNKQGDYTYTISYNNMNYKGKITIKETPKLTTQQPTTQQQPQSTPSSNNETIVQPSQTETQTNEQTPEESKQEEKNESDSQLENDQ